MINHMMKRKKNENEPILQYRELVDVIPFGTCRVGHCYTGFVLHHGIGQTMWTQSSGRVTGINSNI